jgi:hypothetical protein
LQDVRELLATQGGIYERRALAAYCEIEPGGNILEVFAADGSHLASVGWRPFASGLFLC